MPPPPASGPRPAVLFCAFCGGPWDSGLFFGVTVYARPPEQNKVPLVCCHLCHATRPNDELQRLFDAAIGQAPPAHTGVAGERPRAGSETEG